jgi:tetratricopeptide (TPR) repeat protein
VPAGARDLATLTCGLGATVLGLELGIDVARLAGAITGTGAAAIAIASAAAGARGMHLHAGQGNPNWLGLLVAVTLPLTIDLAMTKRSRAAALGVCAQAIALYLSHSRVAWGAALVACAPFAFFRGARARVIAAALLGAALVASPALAQTDVPADLALAGREWIWRMTANAASGALPFGAGLGGFGHAYLDAQGVALAGRTPAEAARSFVNATSAHEEYLQAAAESGPFAALALVAWLLYGSARGWLATRTRTRALEGDAGARVTLLARAARLDPTSGEAALDLGLARVAAGDAAGGLEELRRADVLFADTGARIAIGGAELARGDAAAAERAYRRALEWSPGSFRARAALAEALLAQGKLVEAEREALVARRVLPGDPRGREILDKIREAKMDDVTGNGE